MFSIKSTLNPLSTFIDDFDISCWSFIFQILTFYFQFDDWIVTLILSADVTEIDAFGFKGIVKEFSFSFIDLLFLYNSCNSFFCFWLQPIHTEVLVSIEHSFDW